MKWLRKTGRLFVGLLGVGGVLLAMGWWWSERPLVAREMEFSVAAGSGVRGAAAAVSRVTGTDARMLWLWWRLHSAFGGAVHTLKAGTYVVSPADTINSLYRKLRRGDQVLLSLTIPEGWTFRQMRHLIEHMPGLRITTAHMSEAALMHALGRPGQGAEGRFFPDTYLYAKNSTDLALYRQAAAQMDRVLEAAWQGRASDLPLTSPWQLLILGSVVEKETGVASDRGRIAGVFANRLRLGMRLQSDPSVIYGMGERFVLQRNNITRHDLQTDTPYNTYTRSGLPPTPIALVGRAALQATANPEKTDALYFVARGDGSSEFSATLAQHNRALARYIFKKQ